MNENHAKNAIHSAKRKYEVRFDPSISIHKRNLLFSALLSVFAVLVTPKDDGYTINLGVISGVIDHPIVIYIGLLLITLYQVYYFWLICRQSMVSINLENIMKIEKIYMNELAALIAWDYWCQICRKNAQKNWNNAVSAFTESPKNPRENGNWKVRATTQIKHLEEQPSLIDKIKDDDNFSLSTNRGFYQIDFIYKPKTDDYVYLQQHRDHFWITKKKEFIEYMLPIIVGYLAILSLIFKIYTLSS